MSGPPLILASASPRRRELLERLGLPFTVVAAPVDEHEPAEAEPRALVRHNAALKADWVAARHPGAIVLGADTTVYLDGAVFHKPRDLADARAMLRRLSGRTHAVCTGLAVRGPDGLALEGDAVSEVTFRVLDDALIDRYFAGCNPLDKAGAYGIQEGGQLIVERLEGSLSNVIGLPLDETKQILTLAGLNPNVPAPAA